MAQLPTDLQIRRLAHACRFGEFGKNARNPDRFGPLIVCVGGTPKGYVTKVLGDPLRHFGSRPLLSDGEIYRWCTDDFEPRVPPYRTQKISRLVTQPLEDTMDKKKHFVYERATYAFTCTGNTFIGITVERGFLFYNQKGFDMEQIIGTVSLFNWRKSVKPLLLTNASPTKT